MPVDMLAKSQKDLATTLAAKRPADVTPEVNLRNQSDSDDEAHERGIHSGYETQGRCHQKSKTGVCLTKRTYVTIFFKKKKKTTKTLLRLCCDNLSHQFTVLCNSVIAVLEMS